MSFRPGPLLLAQLLLVRELLVDEFRHLTRAWRSVGIERKAQRSVELAGNFALRLRNQRCRRRGLRLVVAEVKLGRLQDLRQNEVQQDGVHRPVGNVALRGDRDFDVDLDPSDLD